IKILEQIYTTKNDIRNIVQEIARCSGFAVTIKKTQQKTKNEQACGCLFLLKAIPKDSGWQVIEVINGHNHPMAKDARVFSEYRRLTQDAKCTAVQMLKAGAKPSMIYEAIRDENGEPTATRKDISNLGAQIYLSEENVSMEVLITNIEKRGYIVRRENQEEVIQVDATYKMNVYKLPFINFVGISNIGINRLQTFGIAGAWISDESEKSYIWVVEKLFSLIFFDIVSPVFITDNDAVLIGALKKIFLQSEHLLCIWHVLNNFKKNLRKHFVDDSYNEIIKIIEKIIYSGDYKALNLAIALYETLASSLNASEAIKYLDRKVLNRFSNQKSTLLEKLDDILAVPETKLSEIKISGKIKGRGHPSGTKQLPIALEHMEAEMNKKKIDASSLQNVLAFHINDKMSKILLNFRIPVDDIDQVYNLKSDRNCGFRALAVAIRGNEENWSLVKLAMNSHLNKRMEVYEKWLGYNTDLLKQILESRASPCSSSLWFLSPNCAQLTANTFSVSIAIFNEDNKNNHIVYVGMKNYAKVNWPMVNLQYIPICRRYGLENHWLKLFA
ncbi:30737_t:CDS:2, partial [Gigaspora margarita]